MKKGVVEMNQKKAMVIGYSFQDACVRIAYYSSDMEEPQLIPQLEESGHTQIPVCLCKLEESDQWIIGEEAIAAHQQGHGSLVQDLIGLCLLGEPVLVDDIPYAPCELLITFIRKSLNLLHRVTNLEQIQAITFTFPRLTTGLVEQMEQVFHALPIARERLYLEDHKESFFDFMIHQKKELWSNDVLLFDARGGEMTVWNLNRLQGTNGIPFVVTKMDGQGFVFGEKDDTTDAQFTQLVDALIQKRLVSSVLLVGKEFEGEWMKESAKLLCRGRHVFFAENIAAKGACYRGITEDDRQKERRYYYLGEHQLPYHVGMYVWNGREQQYCRLIWSGTSWYEAALTQIFLLDDCDSLCLQLDYVAEEKKSVRRNISLDWLPKRPNLATKIKVDIGFSGAEEFKVIVTDLGLGELFPSSGRSVTERIGG